MQMCIWSLGLNILKLEESKTISGKNHILMSAVPLTFVALI